LKSSMIEKSENGTVRVELYDLFLDVSFQNLTFDGKLLITIESREDVSLNSLGLHISNVSSNGRTCRFEQKDDSLVVRSGPFKGKLEIEYSGKIPDTLAGIYKAPYDGTYMITTDFEAANARRLLPCVDHPDYKAEFKLTVRIDKDLDAISNTPFEFVKIEDDKKIVSFQKTPRMSTYLLYLGIGKFDEIRSRLHNIDVIVAGTSGKARNGEFSLQFAEKSLEFYRSYFGTPYVLPKVHLIGVPEFAAGAMENWGAITFREAALYVDKNSSFATRKSVAQIISHELAHQWFGNLVTMKWWNDLWLNESFATLMGHKVVDAVFPEWNAWQDFLIDETSPAMSMDSLRNTHPIEANVKSPDDIQEIFDAITYGKGASILRMIEAYTGSDAFRKGVQNYLKRYRFSNAAGIDLWNSLDESSGRQVARIMTEWIGKPGHPVVTAVIDRGKLVLRQERFILSGEHEQTIWAIPIIMTVNGELKRLLLDKEEETIDTDHVESLQLNSDRAGFYRVHYKGLDELVWAAKLSPSDRWGIAFDAIAFLLAGRMTLADYLVLVKRYSNEQDYLPAREVSDQLAFLYSIVGSRIVEVSRDFHRSQLSALENKADDISFMMRGIISTRLAIIDEDYAAKLGSKFDKYETVEPDMKEAVAVGYARAFRDFESIARKYRQSISDEEKERLLVSMTTFKDPRLLSNLFELVKDGEVKKQDQLTLVSAMTRNPDAREMAWTWLKSNMAQLREVYEGTGDLSRLLQSCIPILGIGRVEEVERYFTEYSLPEAQKGIRAGLEKLRIYQRLVNSFPQETEGGTDRTDYDRAIVTK
jgi:tricorn protease interacting factor F2/3